MVDVDEDWWDLCDGEDNLEQGHLLNEVVHPLMTAKQLEAVAKQPQLKTNVTFERTAAVILTQSCDILNHDLKRAVLCKVLTVSDARGNGLDDDALDDVREGRRPLYAMLAGPGAPRDREASLIVDFRLTISLPVAYLKGVAKAIGDRPALRSPYIEHLSSSFARCYGRVALPHPIQAFDT
jgi:hypothetical protein